MTFEQNKKILIVDPDVKSRTLAVQMLSKHGCFVQVTGELDNAYFLIERDPPHYVLLSLEFRNLDVSLFNRILTDRRPDACLLLASHDPARASVTSFPILIKPYQAPQLLNSVGC
jgi:DNA-binding NtrC family response regulator